MPTTGYDLQNVADGGTIHEDVLDQIFMIDPVDLPFTERAGTDTLDNSSYSWVLEELAPIDTTRKRIDGSQSSGNDHKLGERVWNESEIQTRICEISDRAQNVDSIGIGNLMADSIMKRNKELRRNLEATFLSNQDSIPDDGTATAGQLGSVQAWIKTHYYSVGGGTAGGYTKGTKKVAKATPGTKAAMTETILYRAEEETYEDGGEPDILMSTVPVVNKISKFFASNTGKAATLYSDVGQGEGDMRAKTSVKVIEGDNLTFQLISNRSQQTYEDSAKDDAAALFGLDMSYWTIGYVQPIQGKPLARTGLFERKELSVDVGLKSLNEKSSFCIADIDPKTAMVK